MATSGSNRTLAVIQTQKTKIMDTLKTITKKDTILTSKDTLKNIVSERNISTETTIYNEPNNCLFNLCDCKLLSDILWPLTVLIILFTFKKQVQKIIDSIGDRIKKGDTVKLGRDGIEIGQELNTQEVKEKAEKEYKETVDEETEKKTSTQKTEFVPKYLSIERRIFEILLKFLYPKYRILSNRRIQNYEYDLIIETFENKDYDYIIEIKYLLNKPNKLKLEEISLNLSFMTTVYENNFNRIANPALIIVTNDDFNDEIQAEIYKHINTPFKNKDYIRLLIIKQNDIEYLTRAQIAKFLN